MQCSNLCRLRRRIESYRRRQSDCMPRFDQSFTGLCEQNLQDTLALKQRFLETKAKRQAKTKDKKQTDNATTALQSSIHVVRDWLFLVGLDMSDKYSALNAAVKYNCFSSVNTKIIKSFKILAISSLRGQYNIWKQG